MTGMDYMDPDVCCPKKLNHSLTHLLGGANFTQIIQGYFPGTGAVNGAC